MSSVDERIVDMQFKAADFVKNTSTVVSALAKLKSSLNLGGAEKSLNDLDNAGKQFNLDNMGKQVDGMKSHFDALRIIGVTALATLASRATLAGLQLVKSFTIAPIAAGLGVYETKINAIQTILANTASEGTKLPQVTAALNQLNTYANRTVYNFGQMAQNIGTFTAAGVDLKTSVASIKGIANLAALSGSSAEQASTAMYQLSQAIAAGRVKLQDWNSVVNAGLGGKVFQNALENTARATGVNIDAIIKKAGSFRNSLQEGWLSSKILTQTLSTFTGDLSDQQLKSLGYSQKQIVQIQQTAKAAVQSATQIRTVTQLHQALAEEVATAWSHVWEAVIGNSVDAAKTLTSIHNVLENAFTKPVNDFANLLAEFSKLGGRDLIIQTIKEAFQDLGAVLKPIGQAFHDVFPPATAQTLISIAVAMQNLAQHMMISGTAAADLRKTFDGLFSLVKIGVDIILDIGRGIASMFSGSGKAAAGIVGITGSIGGFIVKIKTALEDGSGFAKFFTDLGKVIGAPIKLVGLFVDALTHLGAAAKAAWTAAAPFVTEVASEFGKLGSAIAQALSNGDFSNVLHVLNEGLFAAILLQVKKFIKSFASESTEGGFLDKIKGQISEVFEGLTGTLKSMQNSLKSGTLLKIAAAVGILTASVVALSFINVPKLTSALTAITLMFTELLAGMAIISKIAGTAGIIQMTVIAGALNLLATAILILAGAVVLLSGFSWEGLGKGIAAIAALLGTLIVTMKLLSSGDIAGVIASAGAMQIMATALNILAIAVKTLGKLDISTLAKGVGTIAALLLVVVGFQKLGGGEQLVSSAASLVILGAALNVIAVAVAKLGALPLGELGKGLLGIAGALAIIVAAMSLMPPNMIFTATSILIVSAALVVLSQALTTMGGMSWDAIAKSLVELAGSLIIIAGAMILMTEALPGAAALLVVTAALTLLTPVLIALGNLSWAQILTSLAALAGVFIVIGAAGLVLGPLVPVLLGLGAAIALLGVGMLAAGAGMLLFGAGLTAVGVAVVASGVAIASFVRSIIALVPYAISQLGNGLVLLATIIGKNAPTIVNAFTSLVVSLLNAIIKIAPKIGAAVQAILTQFLGLINRNAGPIINTMANLIVKLLNAISSRTGSFVNAGVNIVVGVLNGIARNIGRMGTAGGNVVIAFINAVGAQAGRIAAAGVNMVINLVNNVANTIRGDQGRMNAAGRNLGEAIIEGMISGIAGGIGGVTSEARSIASSALNAAKSFLGVHSPSTEFQYVGEMSGAGIVVGLQNMVAPVETASANLGTKALNAIKDSLTTVNDTINSNLDLQPTITPVIDLTQATQGFSDLATMSKAQLLNASVSTNKATSISAENAAAAAEAGLATTAGGTSITFTQTNNSPKALSTADIYRQTNNQLSKVKGALPK